MPPRLRCSSTDTMDITGIPPNTTLVSKIERLKSIIEHFKVSFTRDMKGVLKYELNVRDIGGPGFVLKKKLKLDEIITHNKVTTNQSTSEREERVLHLVKDGVFSEGNVMIVV